METLTTEPTLRQLGDERIAMARGITSAEEWKERWRQPAHPYPFTSGNCWKHNVEYKVDDFSSEVAFYIDILGLPTNTLDPDYAMFTSPDRAFHLSVVPAPDGGASTPSDAIRIEFMVERIFETVEKLEHRGVIFTQRVRPMAERGALQSAHFTTPHGITIVLRGLAREGRPEPAP